MDPVGRHVIKGTLFRRRSSRVTFSEQPPAPEEQREPARRPARVAQMLALAHHLQAAIDRGIGADRASVARSLGFTRARVTQQLDLLLLAPDIQEQVLALEAIDGVEPIGERALRDGRTRGLGWSSGRNSTPPCRAELPAARRPRNLAAIPGTQKTSKPELLCLACGANQSVYGHLNGQRALRNARTKMKNQTTNSNPLEATNMPRPRTIQTHLPNGDPRGIRVGETNPSIVQVIEVPRPLLADFLAMNESSDTGLYFLLGEDESATPSAYIGRAYDVGASLSTHHAKNDAWNRAMVLASLTNNLTPVHTQLLEWMSIQEAEKAGRHTVENGTPRWKPLAPPPIEAECQDIFDTARMLLATMGQPIFEPLAASDSRSTG